MSKAFKIIFWLAASALAVGAAIYLGLQWWKNSHTLQAAKRSRMSSKGLHASEVTALHKYALSKATMSATKQNGNTIANIPGNKILGIITDVDKANYVINLTASNTTVTPRPYISVDSSQVKVVTSTIGYSYWAADNAFIVAPDADDTSRGTTGTQDDPVGSGPGAPDTDIPTNGPQMSRTL